MFQEKDYMNYRYFYKRAYYLAVIAGAVVDSKGLKGLKAEYSFMNGDQLKPVLVISSSDDVAELDSKSFKWSINVIPSAPSHIFPAGKLHPLKNCVRPQQAADAAAKATNAPDFDPTPVYNASLVADTTYFPYLALLHSSSSTCAAFTDACILGRVWLRQRDFGGAVSKGGFGHFEWAVLMAFLLKGGGTKGHALLAAGYSNYQMFKAMLQFLAGRNLSIDPLVFGTTESVKKAGSRAPVLFDGEHGINVLFKMTPWSYNMVRSLLSTRVPSFADGSLDSSDTRRNVPWSASTILHCQTSSRQCFYRRPVSLATNLMLWHVFLSRRKQSLPARYPRRR